MASALHCWRHLPSNECVSARAQRRPVQADLSVHTAAHRCSPLLISVSNLRLQSVAPEELDLQTAVELLAKKAARNAAKAAKAAGSSPDSAEPGVVSPSTPKKPKASKSAGSGSDSGGSAGGKPGRRKKAAGASGKLAAAAAGGSGPASGNAASSTSSGADGGGGGGGGGSRKPSAWMAFRKARWEGVKAQHSGVAGREVSLHPVFRGLMSGGKCLAAPLTMVCCDTFR